MGEPLLFPTFVPAPITMTNYIVRLVADSVRTPNNCVWNYAIEGTDLRGRSHQPLLDACRKLTGSHLQITEEDRASLFWPTKDAPSMACKVLAGAGLTVAEGQRSGPVYRKYRGCDFSGLDA